MKSRAVLVVAGVVLALAGCAAEDAGTVSVPQSPVPSASSTSAANGGSASRDSSDAQGAVTKNGRYQSMRSGYSIAVPPGATAKPQAAGISVNGWSDELAVTFPSAPGARLDVATTHSADPLDDAAYKKLCGRFGSDLRAEVAPVDDVKLDGATARGCGVTAEDGARHEMFLVAKGTTRYRITVVAVKADERTVSALRDSLRSWRWEKNAV